MHEAIAAFHFSLHPKKTFIGRVERGFDRLGFRISPDSLSRSEESVRRMEETVRRFYEQDSSDT